jgi:hypothetical protein
MDSARIIISGHAAWSMKRRGMDVAVILAVVRSPDQVVADLRGREICQSRMYSSGDRREFLVRVVVEPRPDHTLVVTAYRTSKISKYWRQA